MAVQIVDRFQTLEDEIIIKDSAVHNKLDEFDASNKELFSEVNYNLGILKEEERAMFNNVRDMLKHINGQIENINNQVEHIAETQKELSDQIQTIGSNVRLQLWITCAFAFIFILFFITVMWV